MPGSPPAPDADPGATEAKRAQYREILEELELLETENDASRVQNYNKREALQLLEVIRDTGRRSTSGEKHAWRHLESVVGTARQPVLTKEDAISRLGTLFYLAGVQITSLLESSLETLLATLRDPAGPEARRAHAAKALGAVCWDNAAAQQLLHEQGGVQTLVECLVGHTAAPATARWACHTLAVLLADNGKIWLFLRSQPQLEPTLATMAVDAALWEGWDNNHAAILHSLLYGPQSTLAQWRGSNDSEQQ